MPRQPKKKDAPASKAATAKDKPKTGVKPKAVKAVKKAIGKNGRATSKQVEFKVFSPQSGAVEVGGTFNDWTPSKTRLKKDKSGNWSAKVKLKPGVYQYKLVYDGTSWETDPNREIIHSPMGENNLLTVE